MDRTEALRQAFGAACALDIEVRKPGNVSVFSPGHRMQAALFTASAAAAAPALVAAGRPVGERILGAVQATQAAVHCNTNLGIVLLCAPLLHAAERGPSGAAPAVLRAGLLQTLEALTIGDAQAAFRAIVLAHPGGLGRAPQQDVAAVPSLDLRAAMALAADRDRIAAQYAQGYADLFEHALPAFRAAGTNRRRGMQRVFLELLAACADSHIVRKHDDAVAHTVMSEARPWLARSRAGHDLDADTRFAAWDEDLKRRGINPGTTADLCVATALIDSIAGA